MWRLRECALNDGQLAAALELSSNAVRNRRAKPELWKLSDVERLAGHFGLSSTASSQLSQLLKELPDYLKTMTDDDRREFERVLLFKTAQVESFNRTGWPVRHLMSIQRTLR